MANNSLIPVARVDKNGRTVIRHMKPEGTSAAGRPKMPSMSLPSTVTYNEALIKASTALAAVYGDPTESPMAIFRYKKAKIALDGLGQSTLDRIANHSWTRSTAADVIDELESEAFNEASVNDLIMLDEELLDVKPGMYRNWLIQSFPHYAEMEKHDPDDEYPERRQYQCKALIRSLLHLLQDTSKSAAYYSVTPEGFPLLYVKDDALRNLILNPGEPHSSQDVADIIVKNNISDPDHIRSILNFEQSGLRNGVL